MFTIDRIYGDVEVYEVGKRQFREFCNTLDNIILSLCCARRNDYVVISGWSSFGHQPSYVDYEHVFRSLDRAIGFVSNMQEANLFALLKNPFRINHGRHYEIWHIVDDDELWGDWLEAVADSNNAESETFCDVCCCDASGCASKVVKVSEGVGIMFSKEKCGVDVFEVGKNQLCELLGSYADIDYAADFWVSRGFARPVAALVTARHYEDGSYGDPILLSWVTCEKSVRQILANEYDRDAWYGDCYVYEVWYVVDDDKPTRHIVKPNRYYYAAVHDYGVNFCNDVHYLVRFPDIQARDKFVGDEEWDGKSYKIESITRDVARGICPGAFGDNVEVLPPFMGRDAADADTALDVMAGEGVYYWASQWDGSQVLNCYHR